MDGCLIQEMLYQTRQGNRPDGTFTPDAYRNMVTNLRLKLDRPTLQKENLQNRIKRMKLNWAECHDLFRGGLSGFNWSPETKLWTAEPECWNALIRENAKASKWRNKQINYYDELEELFAKDRATGDGAETAKEKLKRWAESNETDMTINELDKLISKNEVTLENYIYLDGADGFPSKPTQEHPKAVAASKAKKMKSSGNGGVSEEFFGTLIGRAIDSMNKGHEIMANALKSSNGRTAEEIYEELVLLDLEEPFLEQAYDFLLENEKMVKKLFGYPKEKHKVALEKMMMNAP